jgi:hypothetical protein
MLSASDAEREEEEEEEELGYGLLHDKGSRACISIIN